MTNMVKDRPVTAHVFEYTTSFALDADLHFKYPDKGIVPCQIILCMKEKNVRLANMPLHRRTDKRIGKKNQFPSMVLQRFRAASFGKFAQSFKGGLTPRGKPNICVLLDVGTRPAPKSLYYLWKAFDLNSNVGGACGEIATFKGKTWRSLLNPLGEATLFRDVWADSAFSRGPMLRVQNVKHPGQADGESIRILHRLAWGIFCISSKLEA